MLELKSLGRNGLAAALLAMCCTIPSCSSSGSGTFKGEPGGVPVRATVKWGKGTKTPPDGYTRACIINIGDNIEIWKKPGGQDYIKDGDGDFHPVIGATINCAAQRDGGGITLPSDISAYRSTDLENVGEGDFAFDTDQNLASAKLTFVASYPVLTQIDGSLLSLQDQGDGKYEAKGTIDGALSTMAANAVYEMKLTNGEWFVIVPEYSLGYRMDTAGNIVPKSIKVIPN